MPEKLVIQSTGELVAAAVRRATTARERARGLLGTRPGDDVVLVLERARQVHTFGMRYPIDVIFCNADWEVVHVVRAMKPGRVSRWVRSARFAIELPSRLRRVELSRGDRLLLEPL